MKRRRSQRGGFRIGFGRISMGLSACLVHAGCQAPPKLEASLPTQTDRLVRFYPELSGGRFVILADFEDPAQMELFDFVKTSAGPPMQLDPKAGRRETGGAGLRLAFSSPADTLRISNDRATSWHMKRDWRGYDLLLMSVFVPPAPRGSSTLPGPLEITLNAGPHNAMRSVATSVQLQPGWNDLRFDLADAGEQIPLDDIRGLEVGLPAAHAAQTIHLDDLLIAGYRAKVVGDSANREGALYVERVGQRLHVGVGGQFELVFGNGQIVGWYDLLNDPYRTRNIVDGAFVSPPSRAAYPARDRFRTTTSVTEANAVRAVIESVWRTSHEPASAVLWTYVTYRTGQVYVSVETQGQTGLDLSELVFSMNRQTNGRWEVHRPSTGGEAVSHLVFVAGADGPTALVVPAADTWRAVEEPSAEPGPTPVFRTRTVSGSPEAQTVFHVWLSSSHAVSGSELADRAAAFQRPNVALVDGAILSRGQALRPPGAIVVDAVQGSASIILDGRQCPLFSPVIEVRGVGSRTPWVYVNDRLVDRSVVTADGHLLCQLPGVVREQTRVEVLFGAAAGSPADQRSSKK